MNKIDLTHGPDEAGFFGEYGGRFVPPPLEEPLAALEAGFREAMADPGFVAEFHRELEEYSGRPTPLYFARRLSEEIGARVYLKREDLNHLGAHKMNNCLGQALLARRMGATRLIAETGAGQHGVATAAVAARFGMACEIHMGSEDMRRQALNVKRIELLGAEVVPARGGDATLSAAVDQAIGSWVAQADQAHYLLGSAVGPHPFPLIVRSFQAVIGDEARRQILAREGRLPDLLVACAGGGSNAIGLFGAFLGDDEVGLLGVEAAGSGLESGRHAATLTLGDAGVLHGMRTIHLRPEQTSAGGDHCLAAGLDYPGIGPEHSHLRDTGRAEYLAVTDGEALDAFERLNRLEGILPAFESSHALAGLERIRERLRPESLVIVNLSGRGDKDLDEYLRRRGIRSLGQVESLGLQQGPGRNALPAMPL
jgi:tryptophan synthase beta chain